MKTSGSILSRIYDFKFLACWVLGSLWRLFCRMTDEHLHVHSFGSSEESQISIRSIGFHFCISGLGLGLSPVAVPLEGIKFAFLRQNYEFRTARWSSERCFSYLNSPSRLEVSRTENSKKWCSWQAWERNNSLAMCPLPGGQGHSLGLSFKVPGAKEHVSEVNDMLL